MDTGSSQTKNLAKLIALITLTSLYLAFFSALVVGLAVMIQDSSSGRSDEIVLMLVSIVIVFVPPLAWLYTRALKGIDEAISSRLNPIIVLQFCWTLISLVAVPFVGLIVAATSIGVNMLVLAVYVHARALIESEQSSLPPSYHQSQTRHWGPYYATHRQPWESNGGQLPSAHHPYAQPPPKYQDSLGCGQQITA